MKKRFALTLLLITMLLLIACGSNGSGDPNSEPKTYKVTVITSKGIQPLETNVIHVNEGESLSLAVSFDDGYIMGKVDGADYDAATRLVTVNQVKRDMRIRLNAVRVDYATTGQFKFYIDGKSPDNASRANGALLYAGTSVTVQSLYNEASFIGWSFGSTIQNGGKLISSEREFTFAITPNTAVGDECRIFANYSQTQENAVYYYLNGGSVNKTSTNMKNTTYYRAEATDNYVKVTLGINYFDAIGPVACLFWDDGTFYREGYVLKEFNTKPDGSGVGYGSGYKFPILIEGSELYCIWAKETDPSAFTYEDVRFELPTGSSLDKAPHWITHGIRITGYTGNDSEVVIPEKINGKYVVSIGTGALNSLQMDTLVLGRRILEIQKNAIMNCTRLETVYYPDSVYYVSNDSFDAVSWGHLKNFYVNATMAPRSLDGWDFATKFTRFIANPDRKRVALLAGSSGLYGLSAGYLEALLGDEEWCAVNFGMQRSFDTHLIIPLLAYYANEDDILILAPENSVRNVGYPNVYWKSLALLESMLNFFRTVDISYYGNILSTFAEINQGSSALQGRYTRAPQRYERIQDVPKNRSQWCEYDNTNRYSYHNATTHPITGTVRLDHLYRDFERKINVDIRTSECPKTLNYEIGLVHAKGAKIYFGFAPISETAILKEARQEGPAWFDRFEQMIGDLFDFDGILGEAENYIYDIKYFYDSEFHLNNYGKSYRTYQLYRDLCAALGITNINGYYLGGTPDANGYIRDSKGNSLYHATLFEKGSKDGTPVTPPDIFD
ncbi:MAG: hypothetical protein E7620_03395 [Ruminococcaceae bacterium]|nr:hypothetical protein [Oscillospiraceae bacterium]